MKVADYDIGGNTIRVMGGDAIMNVMTFDKDKERCELCKHYNRLKHNFKKGIGFEESHACTVWVEEDYVQEVEPTSMCEMFERKC